MRSTRQFRIKASVFAVASALAGGANAQTLPTGGSFTAGTGAITPGTGSVAVNQTSHRAIIDWTTFNIGQGGTVSFTQPGATSVAVNRVGASAGQSTIDGVLSANGHVMILNPNGVLFGPTASVNVRGLIASTGNINDSQFMASDTGAFAITGATGGSVSNAGTITLTGAGLAAFVAPSVANSGAINAASGRIRIGAAQAATVSLNGGLYELAVTQGVANPSVSNTGTLTASGSGNIVISALDAANIVSGVINLEGIQQASRIEVNGGTVTLKSDLNATTVAGTSSTINVSSAGQIQDGIDIAATSATVNVGAGTFAQTKTLNVTKSLTLAGAGEASTTIDSRTVTSAGGGYALQVTADNVTLRDFTLYGPAVDAGNAYGIKVQPAGSAASSRVNNFSISHVTSRGAGRAELDLNGVVGATIDGVTANGAPVGNDIGSTKGAGIQVTDSANVTIRNSTTRNNQWGGVALYQSNRFFDQQTSNITVEANNVLTETLPLYMQDESAIKNFGGVNLQGFGYAVKNSDAPSTNDQYTWLQYTLGGALDFAVNVAQPGKSTIQGWNVSAPDRNFYVGVGHVIGGGTRNLSIQSAVDAAVAGDLVNIAPGNYTEIASNRTLGPGVGGTYDLGLLLNKDNLTLRGVDASGNPITSAAGVQAWITAGASTNFGMNHGVVADNVTVQGLGFKPYAPAPNKTIEIAGDNFTFRNSVVDNRTAVGGAGALYFGELLTNHQISRLAVTGSTFYDGSVSLQNGTGVAADGTTFQPAADRVVTNNAFFGSSNYTFGGLLLTGKMDEVPWRPLPIGAAVATGNSFSGFDESVLVRGEQQGVDLRAIMRDNTFDRAVLVTDASGNARAGQYVSLNNVTRDKFTIQSSVQAGVERAHNGDTVNVGAMSFAEDVVVSAPRNFAFGGTTLHSLTVNAGGAGTGLGGTVSADGATGFAFGAPIVLLSDTTLSTIGNRNIGFSSTIDGAKALSLQAGTGAITLGGNVGATTALASLTANGSTIAAQSVSTVGNQGYTGALTLNGSSYSASNGAFAVTGTTALGANTTVDASGISFSSAIDGARALSLQAHTGSVTLGGNVGSSTPLASLTANGSTITAQNVSTSGNQSYTGALTLNSGSYTASNGAFNVTGATTLGADTTVDTSGGNQNIAFSGTVNGARALSLKSGNGSITLGGNAGGTSALTSVTAVGSTIHAQNVSTVGNQTYTGALTLNGTTYTATNGAFSAVGAATLGANATVDTSGGNKSIAFSSTVDGAKSLSLLAGTGAITLGGNVGGGTALTSLAATGSNIGLQSVSTSGNQSYTGALALNGGSYMASNGAFSAVGPTTLSANTTVDTSGGNQNISFSSTVNGTNTLSLLAGTGTISLGGNLTLASLSATGSTISAQNVSTVGNQNYTGALTLNGSSYTATNGGFSAVGAATLGADATVNTSGGNSNINFSSTIDGAKALSLVAGTGTIALGGNVGATTALTSLTANGSTIAVQNVSTLGNQAYTGALTLNGASYSASNGAFNATGATTLGANATIASSGITFSSTIDGARTLALQAGTGAIALGGNVGGATPLASLTANGATIGVQNVSTSGNQGYTGALTLNGGSYTASNGAFSAAGATTLGANVTVDTSGGNKSISFSNAINGARALSLQAGTAAITLGGNAGSTTALLSLTATGGAISAQNVATVGSQNYTGALTLNGASYTASNGAFNVAGPTSLGADTTVDTSSGNRNISFSSAIDGAKALSLAAGTGTITLGGNVGGTTPLASLTANGSAITAQDVATVGAQNYGGALTLNGASYLASNGEFNAAGVTNLGVDTTVDTSGGNKSIHFSSTINGTKALSLQAGAGSVTLGGNVGSVTPLASLTVQGSTIAASRVSSVGNQSYSGALTLNGASYTASNGAFNVTGATTLATDTTVDSNKGVSFSGTIDGARVLSLLAGTGAVSLGGNVAVASLTANGSSIAARNVSTSGNQSYTGALTLNGTSYTATSGAFSVTGATTLGANTTIDASGIDFSGAIDGARALALQSGTGSIALHGNAGTTTPLASLTANGAIIAVRDVSTAGNQSYTGALTLNGTSFITGNGSFTVNGATTLSADTTVDTSAGNRDIAFNGDIRAVGGNPYSLTLDAGTGNITLTSGGTEATPLGTLSTNSTNFTLLGTLWVTGFGIDALGAVALSDHSLHAVGGGTSDVINAGTGVTGTASSAGDVAIQSGGAVAANVTATNIVIDAASVSGTASAAGDVAIQSTSTVAANISATNIVINAGGGVTGTASAAGDAAIQSGGNVAANVSASKIVINADQVNATVTSPNPVEIHSPAPVNVAGTAPSLVVDAPGGSVSGSFGQVSNAGGGLIEVNGSIQAPDTLAASANPSRLLPSESTVTGNAAGNPRVSAPALVPVAAANGTVRAAPADAADLLQAGASVELDLEARRR